MKKMDGKLGVVVMKVKLAAIAIMLLLLVLVLAACAVEINGSGMRVSNPSNDAHATAIALAGYLGASSTRQANEEQATRAAESITATIQMRQAMVMGTSTAVALQEAGTATAQAQIANATATAVSHQAAVAQSVADTEIQDRWSATWARRGTVLVGVLIGLAGVAFLRSRAKIIPRGKDGQLPGVLIGNTMHDPARQIGPAATLPGTRWNLETAVWAVQCLMAQQVLPLPEHLVQLTDGGASADQLLDATKSANATAAMAALSRPDGVVKGKDRIEMVKRAAGGGLLGGSSREVKVTVMSPTGSTDWMRAIATAFDVEPKLLTDEAPIQGDYTPVELTGRNA